MPPASFFPEGSGRQNARTRLRASTAEFLALTSSLPEAPNKARSSLQTLASGEREASRSHIRSHKAADRSVEPEALRPRWRRSPLPYPNGFVGSSLAFARGQWRPVEKTLRTPRLFGSRDITFPSTTFPPTIRRIAGSW